MTTLSKKNPLPKMNEVKGARKLRTYNFNFSTAQNNNLLVIGNKSVGKTNFFKALINQEHRKLSNVRSIIIRDNDLDYRELLQTEASTIQYRLSDFICNPFNFGFKEESMIDTDNVLYRVLRLLQAVSTVKEVEWSRIHTQYVAPYIEQVVQSPLENRNFNYLHQLILQGYLNAAKKLADTYMPFTDISLPTNKDEYLLLTEQIINGSDNRYAVEVHKELLMVLDPFITESSPYQKVFNSPTSVPDFDDYEIILIDMDEQCPEKSFLASQISVLTDYLYCRQSSKMPCERDLSVYLDLERLDFSNSSQAELIQRILRIGRRVGMGVRICSNSVRSMFPLIQYFGHVGFFNSNIQHEQGYFNRLGIEPDSEEMAIIQNLAIGEFYLTPQHLTIVTSNDGQISYDVSLFVHWIKQFEVEDSPIGDLAYEMARNPRVHTLKNSLPDMIRYLERRGADIEVIDTLKVAWAKYSRS